MNFVFINGEVHFSVYSFIAIFISQKTKLARGDSSHYSFIFVNVFGFFGKNVKLLTLGFQKIKQIFVGVEFWKRSFLMPFCCFSAVLIM